MNHNLKTCIVILNTDLDPKLKLEFQNKIWADRNINLNEMQKFNFAKNKFQEHKV